MTQGSILRNRRLYKEYGGKWVVFDDTKTSVISAATTKSEALDKAVAQTHKRGLYATKIPRYIDDEARYIGQYVAIDRETNEVIAHDENLEVVVREAEKQGHGDAIFQPIRESGVHFVEARR